MFCFLILSLYFLHFPHVLETILLMWRLLKIFDFWSHFHANVSVKLFTKELNLFCTWAWLNISIFGPFVIEEQVVSFMAVFQLQYSYEYANWSSFTNRSKWASAETYLKRFSTASRTATVKTHIDGCFWSVSEAAVCGIFSKFLGKQMWSPFKVKLCKNSKNNYFPKHSFMSFFHLI